MMEDDGYESVYTLETVTESGTVDRYGASEEGGSVDLSESHELYDGRERGSGSLELESDDLSAAFDDIIGDELLSDDFTMSDEDSNGQWVCTKHTYTHSLIHNNSSENYPSKHKLYYVTQANKHINTQPPPCFALCLLLKL